MNVPAVISLDIDRTMSYDEGSGHILKFAKLARTTENLNVSTMSAARSVPSRPSVEKWMVVRWGTRLDVIVW